MLMGKYVIMNLRNGEGEVEMSGRMIVYKVLMMVIEAFSMIGVPVLILWFLQKKFGPDMGRKRKVGIAFLVLYLSMVLSVCGVPVINHLRARCEY